MAGREQSGVPEDVHVSVVVGPVADAAALAPCFSALAVSAERLDFDVLVLATQPLQPPEPPRGAASLRLVTPQTSALAITEAVTRAEGPLVLLLHPLVHLQPKGLRGLLKPMLAEPSTAVVSGRVLYPNGLVSDAGTVFDPAEGFVRRRRGTSGNHFSLLEERDLDGFDDSLALVRRDAWERLGGADATLPGRYAAVDLVLRAQLLGMHCAYTPGLAATDRRLPAQDDPLREAVGLVSLIRKWTSAEELSASAWGERLRELRDTLDISAIPALIHAGVPHPVEVLRGMGR